MATDKKVMEDTEQDVDATSEKDSSTKGVKVSEEFQKKVHALVNGATKAECSFMSSAAYEREEILRKKDKKNNPEFTDAAMPSES